MEEIIEVNGVKYKKIEGEKERLRILIIDNRGLTFVGRVNFDNVENGRVKVREARCVIRWGTAKHLAELAAKGPRPNTRFGLSRDIEVSGQDIVMSIDCDEEAWK